MIDTKRLRQKILDLAIRGKLVPQDPADEPASVLLERIRAEKLQMVADGRLKKKDVAKDSVIYRGDDNSHYEKVSDGKPICIDDELPFELPDGWEWTRLSSVVTTFGGKTPSMSNSTFWEGGTVPWVTSKDMKYRELFDSQMHVTEAAAETMAIVPAGSVLLVTRSGILKRLLPVVVNRMDTTINQDLKALVPVCEAIPDYIQLVLQANDVLIRSRYHKDGTTVDSIDFDRMLCLRIPIPPIAEQRRIVDTLDELLDLVDEIEHNQAELESLLVTARSKVLDLAIRGKLVAQDPADEPAPVLLERIRAEKLQMVADGRLKKKDIAKDSVIYRGEDNSYYEQRANGETRIVDEALYDLPDSWAWVRLGFVSDYGTAPSASPDDIDNDSWILDLEDIEKNTGKILGYVTLSDRPSLSTKRPFKSGQLLYSKLRPYLNKVLIAPKEGFCTSEILPITLYAGCLPEYLRVFLMSDFFLAYANRCSYGVKMPRLGTTDGQMALIAFPPINEQRRIASAVEGLFKSLEMLTTT